MKDRDVPDDVTASVGAVGFCGSDVWEESTASRLKGLVAESVAGISGLRFAIACLPNRLADVKAKLQGSEPLYLGTSYPVTLRRLLGDMALEPLCRQGSIEGLPARFPSLDGIFELVRSGDSLEANSLVKAADDLDIVRLVEITKQGDEL